MMVVVVVMALGKAADGWSIWGEGLERQLACLFIRLTKAGPCPIMPPAQSFRDGFAGSSAPDVCF